MRKKLLTTRTARVVSQNEELIARLERQAAMNPQERDNIAKLLVEIRKARSKESI